MSFTYLYKNLDFLSDSYMPVEENEALSITEELTGGSGTFADPFVYKISVANKSDIDWKGIILAESTYTCADPQFYLPAFMYGTNRGDVPTDGARPCPKISDDTNHYRSPLWRVRADHLSHPVAIVYDNNKMYAISGSPYVYKGAEYFHAGYSFERQHDGDAYTAKLGYSLGYENYPWLFIDSGHVVKDEAGEKNCVTIAANDEISFELYVYDVTSDKTTDINRLIEQIYYKYHDAYTPYKSEEIKRTVKDISTAIADNAWLEDINFYSLFVFDREEDKYRILGSFSWTNGLSIAVPMLMSAVRTGNTKAKEQALTCIDHIIKTCINKKSGLPYDAYSDNGKWSTRGWWYNGLKTGGHSGYIIGQGLYYILKAYEFMSKEENAVYDDYIAFVRPLVDKLIVTANGDNEFPYILSEETGAGLVYDSFGGSWIMAAITYYMYLTNDKTYLPKIKEIEQSYYDRYVSKVICYGGPLDISKGVDSEGILAYIRAVRYIHALTGEAVYLKHLKDAIEYELTFKFCYNTNVVVPPLSNTGWKSCGGSVTSVVNPHIHPMSSTVVDEMIYYVNNVPEDIYIKDRINDVLCWGCQTYNHYDKEYDYGKLGWMSERFCYSEGLLTERYSDGRIASTWFALMPWAGSSIIEGMIGEFMGDVWK